LKIERVIPSRVKEFHSLKPANLFSSEAWCNCYDERLQRYFILDDSGKTIGGFVAFEGGKHGFKTLITPPFSPHIGLFAEENKNNPVKINSFRKEIIEAISDFIKTSQYAHYKLDFSPEWNDMQPMMWKKIHTTVRYTYRIDLTKSALEITDNLDSSKRNKISKASRDGLQTNHNPNISLAMDMIRDNLEGNKLPYHSEIIQKILAFAAEKSQGIYSFTHKEEKILSVNICVHDNKTAYNLLSAMNRGVPQNQGSTFGLFQSILHAQSKGLRVFDFEGSGVPEIEEFFRSFGGALTPYFSVSGGRWPFTWLLKIRRGV
jgi:lipid II:glycine glycyltransferase (peptidoglycan interpeptide bridge formation enzyme)